MRWAEAAGRGARPDVPVGSGGDSDPSRGSFLWTVPGIPGKCMDHRSLATMVGTGGAGILKK